MASWEEIKKLAADLHRIQLGESAKKLSERNCIEIITNLIEKALIDVVFSTDGKEYITREYLRTQIINETLASNGRISLSDLQQILNVHYQNVENEARFIAETRHEYSLILGQLISRDYFDNIYREIDEKLKETGRLTLSEVTKLYDLPTDNLVPAILSQLNKKIHASLDQIDSSVLYTDSYVQLQKTMIRGALNALTKPTQINRLVNELKLEPGLFFSSYECLQSSNEIRGSLSGGKIMDRAVFIPDIFVESTESYIRNFFYQNGFLELSMLKKLPSLETNTTLRKLFGDEFKSMLELKTMFISAENFDHIEQAVLDDLKRNEWINIKTAVHIPLNESDIDVIGDLIQKKHGRDWHRCNEERIFYNDRLKDKFLREAEQLCSEKASKVSPDILKQLRSGTPVSTPLNKSNQPETTPEKSDGKRGKTGGAAATKAKKGRQNGPSLHDDSQPQSSIFEFMPVEKLGKLFLEKFATENYPVPLVEEICGRIIGHLNAKYREHLESIYLTSESSSFKKNHSDFSEKFRTLFQNVCLFDSGASIFNDLMAEQLRMHLLRTLCTDMVNLAVGYYGHAPNVAQLTPKVRDSTIESMPDIGKEAFQKLNASLNAKDLNAFFDAVEEITAPKICSLNVKNPDKKTRNELQMRYKNELMSQLSDCKEDCSSGLLIVCILLILNYHDAMVHASGKFVPQMVTFLQEKIPGTLFDLLSENQRLVVMSMKNKDDQQLKEKVSSRFNEINEELVKLLS